MFSPSWLVLNVGLLCPECFFYLVFLFKSPKPPAKARLAETPALDIDCLTFPFNEIWHAFCVSCQM